MNFSVFVLLFSQIASFAYAVTVDGHQVREPVEEGDRFVRCKSTVEGGTPIYTHVKPSWAPLGAARYIDLVADGFYDDSPMFRVVPNFLVQFGIAGDPAMGEKWRKMGQIKDDVKRDDLIPLKRGDMSFAGAGADSRTTQVFWTYKDSQHLGNALHETPYGYVFFGMETADRFYSYGDVAPFGHNGPDQSKMWSEGNVYLRREFPKMDYLTECRIVEADPEVVDDGRVQNNVHNIPPRDEEKIALDNLVDVGDTPEETSIESSDDETYSTTDDDTEDGLLIDLADPVERVDTQQTPTILVVVIVAVVAVAGYKFIQSRRTGNNARLGLSRA